MESPFPFLSRRPGRLIFFPKSTEGGRDGACTHTPSSRTLKPSSSGCSHPTAAVSGELPRGRPVRSFTSGPARVHCLLRRRVSVCTPPPEGIRSHRPPLCAVYWVNRGGEGDGTSRSGPGAEGFVRKTPSHELAGACQACVPSPGPGASSERSASASGRGSPVQVVTEGGGPRGMSHSAPEGDGNRLRPERREPLPPSGQIGKWRGWFQAGP